MSSPKKSKGKTRNSKGDDVRREAPAKTAAEEAEENRKAVNEAIKEPVAKEKTDPKYRQDPNVTDDRGETPLYKAADNNHLDIVKMLLKAKATLSGNTNGRTPLHAAAEKGFLQVVQTLLKADKDAADSADKRGQTVLYHAAAKGRHEVVNHLLKLKCDATRCGQNGRCPITIAAQNGHVETLNSLLKASPSKAQHAKEAFPLACEYGHLQCVRHCRQLMDRPKALLGLGLHHAIEGGQREVVDFLMENKADINETKDGLSAPERAAQRNRGDILRFFMDSISADKEKVQRTGESPLLLAIEAGYFEVVDVLLDCGLNAAEIRTQEKWTPLHFAAKKGNLEIVKGLQAAGCPLDVQSHDLDTPLLLAIKGNQIEVVRFLVGVKADLQLVDQQGNSPLHCAATMNFGPICAVLANAGASLDALNREDATPFMLATERHFSETAGVLSQAQDVMEDPAEKLAVQAMRIAMAGTPNLDNLLFGGLDSELLRKHGLRSIHLAAARGVQHVLAYLVKRDPGEINVCSKHGATPLYCAAAWQRDECLRFLLSARAKVNLAESNGWTPLYVAVRREALSCVRFLLDAEADCNQADRKGRGPLYCAAFMGQLRAVRLLIESRGNLKSCDQQGWTPLHAAASKNHLEVADALINAMSDLNAITRDAKETPLCISTKGQNLSVLELLLRRAANINKMERQDAGPLHHAARNGCSQALHRMLDLRADVEQRDKDGYTATFIAAQFGHLQLVRRLLEARADLNAKKGPGADRARRSKVQNESTPLVFAAMFNRLHVVKYLLAAGVDKEAPNDGKHAGLSLSVAASQGFIEVVRSLLNARANLAQQQGVICEPLLAAVENKQLEVVQVLLDARAQLYDDESRILKAAVKEDSKEVAEKLLLNGLRKDQLAPCGWAPLHHAASCNAVAVARLLVSMRAKVHVPGRNGATPLYVAALNGHREVMRVLLEARSDPSCARSAGWTPLHAAASNGHVHIVKSLVQMKVDKNRAKENGTTALFLAASGGHLETVDFLLEAKADKDKSSERRGTPLHAAAARGHTKILQHLLLARANCNESRSSDSVTPLFLAARSGATGAVLHLLEAQADQGKLDEENFTALHIAAAQCNVESCRLLMARKSTKLSAPNGTPPATAVPGTAGPAGTAPPPMAAPAVAPAGLRAIEDETY